ncbi:hypothetical protein ACHWQZ_G000843 [Mnemiopsis leidyi]
MLSYRYVPIPSSLPEIEKLKKAIEEQDIIKVKKTLDSLTNEEQITEYVNQKIGDDSETLLHIASRHDVEILKYFVEIGGDVNGKDKYDRVPLFYAALAGKMECVQYLVSEGGDVQSKNNNGYTPLHYAAISGNINCVQYLVYKGADVNINRDSLHRTPLYDAAVSGKRECVQFLISSGAHIDRRDGDGNSVLHEVAKAGYVDVTQCLLENGADVNATNGKGNTSLHIAVIENKISVINCLLKQRNCNMNITNIEGQTAEQIAMAKGLSSVTSIFKEHADLLGTRQIFTAIDEVDSAKLIRVLVNPNDINRYSEEMTALFYAVSNESPMEIIKILCHVNEIDLNKGKESGDTPLSEAVRLKREDIIKFLCRDSRVNVEHKDWASVEKQNEMFGSKVFYPILARLAKEGLNKFDSRKLNEHGDSLLHMAVIADQPEAINYICEHVKLDFKAKNLIGSSAFDLIFPQGESFSNQDIFKSILLIASRTGGKDVVLRKDSEGRTVLHLAVINGDKEALEKLCNSNKADIDINATDKMGRTALLCAIEAKMDDISLFLLSQPAVKFNDNIFYIMKDIVRRKTSINSKADFILKKYLVEPAVPDQDPPSDISFTLEKLFDTADEKTSILSELGSIIADEIYESDTKTICSALLNVVIIGLQQNANHKRLQYLFFKGSVFRQFVQIFVDIKEEIISNEEKYLEQILKILYISTQSNIRCGYEEDKKPNTEINIRSDNADLLDNEANALDKDNESASRNLEKGVNAGLEVPDKKTGQFIKSLQNKLGEDLYGQFRDRIEDISEMKLKGSGEISNHQLIAKGIYKAYFKPENGCCSALKKSFTDAEDWLSSKIGINKLFHKCTCRGDFAFIFCFVAIFVQASDVYSDARFGFKTLSGFSERLGVMTLALVFATLIHENIRSVVSTYTADIELLRITLGKIDLSDGELSKNSELNYYNNQNSAFKWIGRFFWTFNVRGKSKSWKESTRNFFFNALSILMLRPIVDRLIVLTHSPSHLRAIYMQQSKQKSLNQYYMILEQIPELLVQFYVFQIYFNILETAEGHINFGCTGLHSFNTYRTKDFECVENLWRLKICASWLEIYSMLVPFIKIPNSMVSLEEVFRKLSPETPKMSVAASWLLYTAYILMIPSRLFLFAAVMHSATNHLYVAAYLGLVTFVWLIINVYRYTVMRQKSDSAKTQAFESTKIGRGTVIGNLIKIIWSLLLFTGRDVVFISLRQADAYLLSPSEVSYKTLRTWRKVMAISSFFFLEGVVGAVFVEHNYPCGRNTEIFKYQGWLYLITLIISVTIITQLSYILQPTKINIIPRQFPTKAALICSLGLLMWTVGVIVFLTTTKNSATAVRLPLIITTILILFIFLVVVSVLRFFSEAKLKQPKEKKNEREDSAMKDKLSEDKSCCLLRVPCCLCCSQDLASTPEEQICSAESTNNSFDTQEPSQSQIICLPAILKQRINTYEHLPKEEDIELAPVNNSSENVKL